MGHGGTCCDLCHSGLPMFPSKSFIVSDLITSHQSEWPSSKNLQIINAGEDVEKREPSYTVGENVN